MSVAVGPSIATLVARLSREHVERLLVHGVEAGAVVTLEEVLACLPDKQSTGVVAQQASVTVTGSSFRTGTGLFDQIEDEILVPRILARLPSKDRFACAISVCRAWRSLRDAPALWRDIAITSDFKEKRYGEMDGASLLRLVSWLPDAAGVTSLDLECGDKPGGGASSGYIMGSNTCITPDAIKKALSAMPSLTSLRLHGRKVTAAVIAHLTKLPLAKKLTTLRLELHDSVDPAATQALFKSTGNLKSLSLPAHLATEQTLAGLAATLKAARGGGVPLLSELHITDQLVHKCSWDTIVQVRDCLATSASCTSARETSFHVVHCIPPLNPPLVSREMHLGERLVGFARPLFFFFFFFFLFSTQYIFCPQI